MQGTNPTELTPAETAELALLLEVGSDPKPGNVDRGHDHSDTKFHHYLAGAVGVSSALGCVEGSLGDVFYKVVESVHWHGGGNTHFGSLLLLVPLVIASRRGSVEGVDEVVRGTGVEDAVRFYEAFDVVDVYVESRDRFDVYDEGSREDLRREGMTLYDVMEMSAEVDGLAREWVEGFGRCFHAAELLDEFYEGDSNSAVVETYIRLLAEECDTFVMKKHDRGVAEYVRKEAKRVVEEGGLHEFDEDLVSRGVNPGTTADICCAGLYISLRREGGFGL